jgi:hypothetical protein
MHCLSIFVRINLTESMESHTCHANPAIPSIRRECLGLFIVKRIRLLDVIDTYIVNAVPWTPRRRKLISRFFDWSLFCHSHSQTSAFEGVKNESGTTAPSNTSLA